MSVVVVFAGIMLLQVLASSGHAHNDGAVGAQRWISNEIGIDSTVGGRSEHVRCSSY